jgi:hypothetical protein
MIVSSDMLEPANTPAPAPDLGQRIRNIEEQLWIISNALSDETVLTASGATKEIEAINRRLSALETNLTKEATTFDVWRRAHMNMQDRALAAIKERLDALEANPPPEPDQPIEVGDEVWVKGRVNRVDMPGSQVPYRIDFGDGYCAWPLRENVKRADQLTRAERIAKLNDLIDVIKRA